MIIGKKDKSKIIELQEEVKSLNTKIAIMENEHKEKESELLNLLKAFLNKISSDGMIITLSDLAAVEDYSIIKTKDYLSTAYRYQIVKAEHIYSKK